jgi:O-antigen/teichoic acid export membrane protein
MTGMRAGLQRWLDFDLTIISNATSMLGTTAVTSGLGFAFWWVAARYFAPAEVGFAAAAISAMMLLGTIGVLGFGTLLIGELPHLADRRAALITTALLISGLAGTACGLAFAVLAPGLAPDLRPLSTSLSSTLLFGLGVGLTAVTTVLDQALIGLLQGQVQLGRNTLFAVTKLALLVGLAVWAHYTLGLGIYAVWLAGNVLSLAAVAVLVVRRGVSVAELLPWPGFLRRLGRAALDHHLLNLALQAPGFALPVLVTALLSARANAGFYVGWTIVSFVFVAPAALTTVLYAVGAADIALLGTKLRMTLRLSFLAGLLGFVGLFVLGSPLLSLFGKEYADEAARSMLILSLAVFPLTVKLHYVAVMRIRNRFTAAAWGMALGGILELLMAGFGAHLAGLDGLSAGWVLALCVEAAFVARGVYLAAIATPSGRQQVSDPARWQQPTRDDTRIEEGRAK